jgi:hypothetical protein
MRQWPPPRLLSRPRTALMLCRCAPRADDGRAARDKLVLIDCSRSLCAVFVIGRGDIPGLRGVGARQVGSGAALVTLRAQISFRRAATS